MLYNITGKYYNYKGFYAVVVYNCMEYKVKRRRVYEKKNFKYLSGSDNVDWSYV